MMFMVLAVTTRLSAAAALPPRILVEDDKGRKESTVAIISALLSSESLNKGDVFLALNGLDGYLKNRLKNGAKSTLYPEVIVSITKTALQRGWSAGDAATLLSEVQHKIDDESRSPELTRQLVVLGIGKGQRLDRILGDLAQPAAH